MKLLATAVLLALVLLTVACSHRDNVSYQGLRVRKLFSNPSCKMFTVSEDQDKNTITLDGTLHSDETKSKAAEIAKAAAGTRIIAVGSESQAKDVASNLDYGIEKNYKAALIASALDKQRISFTAKNGLLTLTGSIHSATERHHAQKLAAEILMYSKS